jgi:2-iminoacetate synthase ThiH
MKKDIDKKREKSKKLLPLYYTEGDRVIFTEEFHIQRGHCCGNGCRHCPFEPKHQKGNFTLSEKFR